VIQLYKKTSLENDISREDDLSKKENEEQRPKGGLGISLAEVAASSISGTNYHIRETYREQWDSCEEPESSEFSSSEEEFDPRPARKTRARPKHNITATEWVCLMG